jgi:hypothetical protein
LGLAALDMAAPPGQKAETAVIHGHRTPEGGEQIRDDTGQHWFRVLRPTDMLHLICLKNNSPPRGNVLDWSGETTSAARLRISDRAPDFLTLCALCSLVSACASGPHIADMPHWIGGLPPDAPPRRGTPEYDAWQAERAKEAARPKTGSTSQPTR